MNEPTTAEPNPIEGREFSTSSCGAIGPRHQEAGNPRSVIDLASLGVLFIYLILSLLFFGRLLPGRLSTAHIGNGPDPDAMTWFIAWWTHAIANGWNPFLAKIVWYPAGINLTWQTSVPLAAIAAAPLTIKFGPLVTYNLLCLLSLPLDAWCAFILCRYITNDYRASLLGGYVYGFSAYALCHLAYGHLALVLVFPIPLAVYFALLRIRGEIGDGRFVVCLSATLVAQFLLWPEGFATMTIFGGLALLWALFTGALAWDTEGRAIVGLLGWSYALTGLVVSPYLYYFFVDFKPGTVYPSAEFSVDLLSFILPTPFNELGRAKIIERLTGSLIGGWLAENGAYLGLPTIAIALHYGWRTKQEPVTRMLVLSLLTACVLALGPVLHVAGIQMPVGLPWLIADRLPVLNNALPARFPLYGFLVLAVIVSMWFSRNRNAAILSVMAALLLVLFDLPSLSADTWVVNAWMPQFFARGSYRQYLKKGEVIITLPYGYQGDCMLWQAESNMYFRMAEGYSAGRPADFQRWPIVEAFLQRWYVPDAAAQFRTFLDRHGVQTIVVTDSAAAAWHSLLSTLELAPVKVDDVQLYRLPTALSEDKSLTLDDMSSRFNLERFGALVEIARTYVAKDGDAAALSVLEVEKLGLLPEPALIGPEPPLALGTSKIGAITDPHNAYGVYLGKGSDGRIAIGIFAWNPIGIIRKLIGITTEVYFPHPTKVTSSNLSRVEEAQGWLVAEFTPQQLVAAARTFGTQKEADDAVENTNGKVSRSVQPLQGNGQ